MNICKGHVYIIFCHVNPKIYYVGSTFNQLKQRWNNHKQANNKCSIKKYFNEYGIENFSIKLIKSYNVYREHSKDNKHLSAYEQLWINKFRDSCNENSSFNPLKKLRDKEYNKNNKEQIKQYKKQYNEKNKEKIKKQKKEYYKDNKEHFLEKKKEYYRDNKDKIKERDKKKYTCECGSTINIKEKLRHLKSIKHQNYIKNNINNI